MLLQLKKIRIYEALKNTRLRLKVFGFKLLEGWKTAAEDYLDSDKMDDDQSVAMKQDPRKLFKEQSRKQKQDLDHFLIMVSPPLAHTMW